MPKTKDVQTDKKETDPFDDAFVFLKSIPEMPQYKRVNKLEAYALHADWLRDRAKECDAAAIPKGSNADLRFTAQAARARLRADLCSHVADGQSLQAAIGIVFRVPPATEKTEVQAKQNKRATPPTANKKRTPRRKDVATA